MYRKAILFDFMPSHISVSKLQFGEQEKDVSGIAFIKPDEAEETGSLETREFQNKKKVFTNTDIDIDIVAGRKINE